MKGMSGNSSSIGGLAISAFYSTPTVKVGIFARIYRRSPRSKVRKVLSML